MSYYGGKGRGRGGGGGGGGGATAAAVYVGNLSWETTWQDLKDHFRAAGDVTHADVTRDALNLCPKNDYCCVSLSVYSPSVYE